MDSANPLYPCDPPIGRMLPGGISNSASGLHVGAPAASWRQSGETAIPVRFALLTLPRAIAPVDISAEKICRPASGMLNAIGFVLVTPRLPPGGATILFRPLSLTKSKAA